MTTPTASQRHLARELRRIREAAGMSQGDVARATGINNTSLVRLEGARHKPQRRTLLALLDTYRVKGKQREALLELYANVDKRGMQSTFQDGLPGEYPVYIAFENDASCISIYESDVVPGLLATPDYAEALMAAGPPMDDEAIHKRLKARAERQKRLHDDSPPELHVVIGEAAIRYEVGGRKVMRDQVQHLLDMAERPNVTLQMSPFGLGANGIATGSFVALDFEEAPPLGYVEHVAGDVIIDAIADVMYVKEVFNHLRTKACDPQKTTRMLREVLG